MAKLTMVFGFILLALGVLVWLATGHDHTTALIPAWFGIALALCGALARTQDGKKRMMWMHVAVTIGLIGFLFPAVRAGMTLAAARSAGGAVAHPAAVNEEIVMALFCFIFVVMCVRSFIAARRSRVA